MPPANAIHWSADYQLGCLMEWFGPALLAMKLHSWQRPTDSSHTGTVEFWQRLQGLICTSLISESVTTARRVGEKLVRERKHVPASVVWWERSMRIDTTGVRRESSAGKDQVDRCSCWRAIKCNLNCQRWKSKMVNLVWTWHFLPRLDATTQENDVKAAPSNSWAFSAQLLGSRFWQT